MQPVQRQPVSHRWVWIGLVALAVLVLGVFVAGYWFLVRYEDKVARHVPRGALAVLRLDVEQVVLYQPIRKHVFPVLDGAKTQSDRLAKVKSATGVNLGMDLREIMVAVLPQGQYVAAVGGLFPQTGLLAKLLPVLPTGSGCALRGVRLECKVAGSAVWFEQAQDGVVIASNSEQALTEALRESEHGSVLGLQQAPIALVLQWKQALSQLPVDLGAFGAPDWVSDLSGVFAHSDLGDPLQVEVVLAGVPASKAESVKVSLQQAQTMAGLVRGPDLAGERGILARAAVNTTADGRVALGSQWERKDVDRAARAFADWLEGVLGQ